MKIEPNLLIAAVTACALGILVLSTGAFGGPEATLRYVAVAFVTLAVFMAFSQLMQRSRGRVARPLIRSETPGGGVWLAIFPVVVLATAILPLFAPRADYTFMILIAAIRTGVTLQSAFAAQKAS